MNINEALSIIPRSIISLATLFAATKLLGKKQISELSIFDYTIGISIGNFTSEMILVIESQMINGIVAILVFGIVGYLISYLSRKSIIFRRKIFGVPTIIIENGNLVYDSLKRLNIDLNDFLEEARISGYFNIEDIAYAIMEANGKISFLAKAPLQNPTNKDLNIKTSPATLPANIIIDSKLMIENIDKTNKSRSWFIKKLKEKGYKSYENILLATYHNNTIYIQEKTNKKITNSTLE